MLSLLMSPLKAFFSVRVVFLFFPSTSFKKIFFTSLPTLNNLLFDLPISAFPQDGENPQNKRNTRDLSCFSCDGNLFLLVFHNFYHSLALNSGLALIIPKDLTFTSQGGWVPLRGIRGSTEYPRWLASWAMEKPSAMSGHSRLFGLEEKKSDTHQRVRKE